ncbi:hypothetical protein ACFO9E_22715 [Streptomyces maoxianensis]|uniref:DUF4760 domain-containing protein n=1 Tax=Streptomyces maoxianensis TaxID=1459942 RepID=A0ABV9GDE6_9ACTN
MNTDGWAVVVASVALVVSVGTWLHGRHEKQRDLFLSLHERLTHPDFQSGRRILWDEIHHSGDVEVLIRHRPQDFRQVSGAIAMFDILGLYVAKKYVNKDAVLQEWGSTVARTYLHGVHVLDACEPEFGWRPWPHFEELGEEADRWHVRKGRRHPEEVSGAFEARPLRRS